jgi:phosphoribosylaminoimidazole-succinocarboxamide synthase
MPAYGNPVWPWGVIAGRFELIDKARSGLDNRIFNPYFKERNPLPVLLQTHLGAVPLLGRGKVRDLYAVDGALLLVATDRISAFDHVLGTGIPGKGKILTQISLFWFELLADIVPNHLITAEVGEYPAELKPYADQLEGRSMLVKKAAMFPVECVARGYLAGSGWKEYCAFGTVCGIPLPEGLEDGSRLPEPLFTPATKSKDGMHDLNISYEETVAIAGSDYAAALKQLTLENYRKAASHAESRGMILADTKFEFGRTAEGIILADEVLTPDSSRFWEGTTWKPGGPQPSFDKQYVRDYLESIQWNKQAPAPSLPPEVVERTQQKYVEAYRRLTGRGIEL